MQTYRGGTRQARLRTAAATALAAVAAGVLVPGGQAALPKEEYVPFVTDFPQSAAKEQYVPFVTDFPKPVTSPVSTEVPAAKPGTSGIKWAGIAVGSAVAAALAVLLAASWLVAARRVTPARS